MASHSSMAVGSAIAGNSLVAAAKLGALFADPDRTMLSEGIHLLADDTMNQVLLLIGIKRAGKAPNATFQHVRRERFVWALISAVGIFFLGCGFTLYHGVHSYLHPSEPTNINIAITVLIVAFVVEAIVLYVAYKSIKADAGTEPFVEYLFRDADPAAVAVLFEDAAACFGVIIALVCIFLTQATGDPRWDAIGSICIGVLLGVLAIWLIARNHRLLVGVALPESEEAAIRAIFEQSPYVERVANIASRQLDTDVWQVRLGVVYDGSAISERWSGDLRDQYDVIHDFDAFRDFVHAYGEWMGDRIADVVDELEAQVRARYPNVRYIDVEAE